MTTFVSKEVADGLEVARKNALRKKSRLRVRAGSKILTILKYWDNGFTVDTEDAPQLRGLVDLYDGTRHLYQCLIIASAEDRDEIYYEFKRNTLAVDRAPLDFVPEVDAPIALISNN